MYVCLHVCVCVWHLYAALMETRRGCPIPETGVTVVMRYHVGAGSRSQALYKSRKDLRQLLSPGGSFLNFKCLLLLYGSVEWGGGQRTI